jgi:hypothetical protein
MSLTPSQIRAAELLSKGHSHQEVGDAVGVSRRTILRWLKQEDFKNLSFGLVGRASQQAPQQAPQRSPERHSGSLTPQDLVPDALAAVQGILTDPDARTCDRIKAASLIGEWAGLSQKKSQMVELEAIKVLVEAGWVPDEVLDAMVDSGEQLNQRMKNALAQNGHQKYSENGHKEALLHKSEEGTFGDGFDDDE